MVWGSGRPSCGCVKTTSWKYHSTRNTFSSKSSVLRISTELYKAVMRNKGCGGIDKMSCEQVAPMAHDQQGCAHPFLDGRLLPSEPSEKGRNTQRQRQDAPVGNTYSDRPCGAGKPSTKYCLPIYENQFSKTSYGFRPRRGCHDALRGAQRVINEGYTYVVDLDLERFFDTVSHSKFIEILSRTIKDGRVVSLIHKYLRSGVMNKGLFEASEERNSPKADR